MTPLQIEIIKKFGRKELTEGCIFSHSSGRYMTYICDWWRTDVIYFLDRNRVETYEYPSIYFEILWHLPHLEDIFRVAEESGLSYTLFGGRIISSIQFHINDDKDIIMAYEPSLPLIEQDESTLSQLLSLFK